MFTERGEDLHKDHRIDEELLTEGIARPWPRWTEERGRADAALPRNLAHLEAALSVLASQRPPFITSAPLLHHAHHKSRHGADGYPSKLGRIRGCHGLGAGGSAQGV